jgi:hypothetical protein
MNTKGWLRLVVGILLATVLLYPLISEETLAQIYSQPNIFLEKQEFSLNEKINININSGLTSRQISENYELTINEAGLINKFLGELTFPVLYIPSRVGTLTITLTDKNTQKIISQTTAKITDGSASNQINPDIIIGSMNSMNSTNYTCDDAKIETNKLNYAVNEEVKITVLQRPQVETTLIITSGNKIFRHHGDSNYAVFPASQEGIYDIFLECGGAQIFKKRFEVKGYLSEGNQLNNQLTSNDASNNIASSPNSFVQNTFNNPNTNPANNPYNSQLTSPFMIKDSRGTSKLTDAKIKLTYRGIEKEILNPTNTIKSISFRQLNDYLPLLSIEDIESPYPVNDLPAVQSYAVDPSGLDFTDATLIAVAKGTALYKCKDYNFQERNCFGSWEKVRDIVPGEKYEIMLTRQDPLFSELNTSFRCGCEQSVTSLNSGTMQCDVYCQHTISIPENATSFKLTSMIYNTTVTITKSAGMSTESGSHYANYDHDQNVNDGDEARIGGSTTTTTTTEIWTNSSIAQSGARSFTDLDCNGWPSYCTYYVYLNTTYSFAAPGASRRDVTLNISVNVINYTINYTLAGNFTVTLVSPENNYYTNLTHPLFTYTPASVDYSVTNCSIYTNETSWSIKNTSTSVVNGSQNTIRATFTNDGSYLWNVRCYNSNNSNMSGLTNRTIIIDTIKPSITLNSPADYYTATGSSVIDFKFSAFDSSGIRNCSLFINNVQSGTSSIVINNAETTISYSLQNGVYNWSIGCYDIAGNFNISQNRTINISVMPVILRGYWYESYTSDCATTPCHINLAQQTDGTENTITGTISPAQTATIVDASSPYMGSNGAHISSSSTVTFSTYFNAAGGNLAARWYLYYQNTSGGTTLICSNTGGTGVTGGAASTGTCTTPSNVRMLSTDKFYYVIDLVNSHPSQSRTFDHRIDHISSFFNITGFYQVGNIFASLLYPNTSQVYPQGHFFNMSCNVTCLYGSCLNTQVYAQYNNSGTWTTITAGAGNMRLFTGETNPHNLGILSNQTTNTSFNLNATNPGTTQIRCYATSTYENYATNSVQITVASTSAPIITLNYPGNNSWINTSNVAFRYTPASFNNVVNCSINIDGIYNYTNYTITPNVVNYFYLSNLEERRYNWSVNCTDENGAIGNSSNYHFDVDTNAPYLIDLHELQNATNITTSFFDFNWTVYDARAENLTCSLLINGTVNKTVTSFSGNVSNATATNFRIGFYTWAVRCNDSAGNLNTSETRTFRVVDQAPSVSLVSPRNNTGVNSTTPFLFYNATDNFALGECRLFINGVYNQSNATEIINGGLSSFTVHGLIEQQSYNWSVSCTDDNNNNATTSTWLFYVDTVYPNILLYNPYNDALLNTSNVQFAFNATDNYAPLECRLYVDGVLNASINTTSGSIVNISRSGHLDGNHTWYVTCADIANNTNSSETRNFTINSTPTIIQMYPANNTHIGTNNLTLKYNASDNDGISSCELYVNGQLNQTTFSVQNKAESNFSLLNLIEGVYNWSISCIDNGTFANYNSTQNLTFTIDTSSPNVYLIDPQESQVLNTSSYLFKWNVTDNYATELMCNLTLAGIVNGTNILSVSGNITEYNVSGLRTGSYNWSVSCVDNASNSGYSSLQNFSVILPPKVSLVSPLNDTGDSLSLTTFRYIPSEGSGVYNSCTLILNGIPNVTNNSIIPEVQNSFTVNLPDGKYDWNVECVDSNSLHAQAPSAWTYYVDSVAPNSVNALYPYNGSIVGVNNISFIFNASDATSPLLSCTVYIDDGTGYYPIASDLNTTPGVNYTHYSIFSDGDYSWYVDCTDKGGNYNISEINYFTVKAPPNVTLIYPANYSWFNISDLTLTYFPSDDIQITNCSWYIDGIFNGTTPIVLNKQNNTFTLNNLAPKQYNWTVECRDSDGNYYTPPNYTFYVDQAKPTIIMNYPAHNEILNMSTVLFNFTAYDDQSPRVNCSLTIDDVINRTNILVNTSIPYSLIVDSFSDGAHRWNMTCVDLAGNMNTSETRNFTVAEPPRVTLRNPANYYRTNITDITLYYFPTDNSGSVSQCALIINGLENQTNNSIIAGVENNFTLTNLPGGTYFWDVNCSDASGNSAVNGTPKTFSIDLFPPNITLLNPQNEETFNTNNITFNWTAIDFNSSILLNCTFRVSDLLGERTREGLSFYSGEIYSVSETNLSDGIHYWNVTCMDDFGNVNTSATNYFYINQPDLLINSTQIRFNNNNPNLGEQLNITVNVTNIGGVNAQNAVVEFWDGNPDEGGIFIGNDTGNVAANGSRIFSINWNITEGYHTIYVLADPANLIAELIETNNNGTANISVLSSVINSPPNNSSFNYNNITFNFTLTDYTSGLINYTVFVDGVANGQTGQGTDNESIILNITLNEGIRTVIIQAMDVLGRRKNSTSVIITVDRTPPNSSILTANNTWYNYTTPLINITATDNIDSMINFTIYANSTANYAGNISNGTSLLINLNSINEGIYDLTMEAYDDLNNTANSTQKRIYVDLTPPSTTLISPQGGVNFSSRSVTFNYTPYDNMAQLIYCNLTLDDQVVDSRTIQNGNSTTYSISNLYEGTHYWNVTCRDQAHNYNTSETWNFTVYIGPSINLISPYDNFWSRNSTNIFYFNVSDETGIENCSLLLNGTIVSTKYASDIIINSTNNISASGMNGTYLWAVECYDNSTYRAYNVSLNRTIYVDIEYPNVTMYTRNDTWYRNNPTIYFNLSDNMDSVLNYTIFINGTANITGTANNGINASATLNGLSNGTYEIILQATDEALNFYNGSAIVIGVDTILPSINLLSPANDTNSSFDYMEFNFSAHDNSLREMMCNLTLDNISVLQNISVNSGQIINYTVYNLLGGYHYWNVTCADLAGNKNTSETRRFYILRPDIFVNASNFIFNNSNPRENETIQISALIENIGTTSSANFTVEFWEGLPGAGGRQINGNISINLTAGESRNISVNYNAVIGTKQIWVFADRNNSVMEENETNNNASKSLFVGLWHYAMGTTLDRLVMTNAELGLLYDWTLDNSSESNIFVVDSDSNINWLELHALGRDISNNSAMNDFEELDMKLNSTGFADSINYTYTSLGAAKEVNTFTIYGSDIDNIPVCNSTVNSNFKTGIIWDSGDGGVEYNGTQDIAFITKMRNQLEGYNSTLHDYEIRIPATLRSYSGPSFDRVEFYMELK